MEKIEPRHCANKSEAQALANFLWNEKRRHLEDVAQINLDLDELEITWEVAPYKIVSFVKP